MNGFILHGIQHTSPSSINAWADAPDFWLAKYIMKRKFPQGAAMLVGNAVEAVVASTLRGMSFDEALKQEVAQYNKKTLFMGDDETRARVDTIAPMAQAALDELRQYGEPDFEDGQQKKISITANCGYFKMPVIGFLDFHFPKHGVIVDLKTTSRVPSSMSASHRRQATIYKKAMGNQQVRFLYVTPKKSAWLDDDREDDTISEVKNILTRQEKFLNLSKDAARLLELCPVSYESFYWTGAKEIRAELFGV